MFRRMDLPVFSITKVLCAIRVSVLKRVVINLEWNGTESIGHAPVLN